MSEKSSPRHRAREVALQVLYAIDLGERRDSIAEKRDAVASDSEDRPKSSPEDAFETAAAHFELPEGARPFAKELVAGVRQHREELDRELSVHAVNWRIERMAAVDRNILRLSIYELTRTQTPPAVVIDQAIELARRFADDRSPGFVNGVLDAVARARTGDAS